MAQKKITVLSVSERIELVDKNNREISIRKQCKVLRINRSNLYYEPRPEKDYNLELMNLIDEEFTQHPFMGVKKMTEYLRRNKNKKVGVKRVRRLMREMGLEAICPGPNTSRRRYDHKVYPYLLKEVEISKPDQVWASDITYIRLNHGFVYLAAIIDWYSRYVVSWKLSNTLDTDFCVEALEEALSFGIPEIFNTDQGSQFTSGSFVNQLLAKGINVSMDGRGRAADNIFVERLWRTVKYEEIYLNNYDTITEVEEGLRKYFQYYNQQRLHQSLDYKTPWETYFRIGEDIGVIHISTVLTKKEKVAKRKKQLLLT